MIINNSKYTETVGGVKATLTNVGGQAETREYNENERRSLSASRPETSLQSAIYDQPIAKTILNDLDGSLSRPKND